MDKEIWALRIQEIIRAIDAMQTHLIIDNEGSGLHHLFEHWNHLLKVMYKNETGEDYEDPFKPATH